MMSWTSRIIGTTRSMAPAQLAPGWDSVVVNETPKTIAKFGQVVLGVQVVFAAEAPQQRDAAFRTGLCQRAGHRTNPSNASTSHYNESVAGAVAQRETPNSPLDAVMSAH
jgi:hypothetical protein